MDELELLQKKIAEMQQKANQAKAGNPNGWWNTWVKGVLWMT